MFLTSPFIDQAIALIEGFERNRDVTPTMFRPAIPEPNCPESR